MDKIKKNVAFLIFIFWIFVPTLDQYLDLSLALRLLKGPDPDLKVGGGWYQSVLELSITTLKKCSFEVPFQTNSQRNVSRANNKNSNPVHHGLLNRYWKYIFYLNIFLGLQILWSLYHSSYHLGSLIFC